jgi:hypothetical protein
MEFLPIAVVALPKGCIGSTHHDETVTAQVEVNDK